MSWARCRHRIAWALATRPSLYLPIARLGLRLSSRMRGEAVGRGTQIVIEGFPRCANTFSVAAFRLAQPDPIRIAHHLHSPAQVLAAVRWEIPTIVLVREPMAAAASYATRNRDLPLTDILDEYRRFYTVLEPVRDRIVIGHFDEVVREFGAVIARVNRRFGTAFGEFESTEENVRRCFRSPSPDARRRKQQHLETLGTPPFVEAVAAARAAYDAFVTPPASASTSRACGNRPGAAAPGAHRTRS